MPIYKDKRGELTFQINGDGAIKLEVIGLNETKSTVTNNNGGVGVSEDENKTVFGTDGLKNKEVRFTGASENIVGDKKVEIEHKITQVGGNSLTYKFPGDYDGDTPYPESDNTPTYMFYIKFI